MRWSAIRCLCWKGNSACQTMNLLSKDVTLWADGGGKIKQAALRPIRGRDAVARFSPERSAFGQRTLVSS